MLGLICEVVGLVDNMNFDGFDEFGESGEFVNPRELSLFMKEAGLIGQEEQLVLESYLWNTAFEEIF